jgi:hypothetical protein
LGAGISAGAFVVLAAITLTMAWKKNSVRLVAVFALLTGLAGGVPILAWLGGLAGVKVLGASVAAVVVVVGAIILWHEMVKNNGRHHLRTPIVAFVWAVALVSVGGAVGSVAQDFGHGIVTTVDKVTPNGTNG